MKKITLALFALVVSATSGFSQATSTIQVPPSSNASTQNRAPNGNSVHKYQRGCFIIPQSDCQAFALTNSVVTHWGFKLLQGTAAVPVTGNFTLYIDNTPDAAYNKGTNWATAIAGMPVHYMGNMTVPVAAGAATITLPLNNNFTYSGNGIYVAYEWDSAGPFDAGAATYDANHLMTIGGATGESATTNPTTLLTTNFRPAFLWHSQNIATNEASVVEVRALGSIAKLMNAPQTVEADVRNSSNVALTNVTVGLVVTGANPYTDVQTISNIPAGAIGTAVFNAFPSPVSGLNNMNVAVGPDQNVSNNVMTWTQSVTCNVQAQNPPTGTYTSGVGFPSATGCILNRFKVPVGADLSGVRVSISNDAATTGKSVCGVLLDAAGTLIAYSSNTIVVTAAMLSTFQTFNFAPTSPLTSGTDYHVGLVQLVSGHYPIAYLPSPNPVTGYYRTPLAGGTPIAVSYGYFGIEPVFSFTNTTANVVASKTLVCKNAGHTVTLTATGLDTYTWTPGGANGTSVVVTPTIAQSNGVVVYNVIGTDAASGCKSTQSSITVSVSACAGIASNDSDGFNIKLFPNPAVSGKSTITGLVGTTSIAVYNTLGQVVLTQQVSTDTTVIDLSSQPSGNYLVKISDSNSETRTIKVVNQN